jgi:hypothetical protein
VKYIAGLGPAKEKELAEVLHQIAPLLEPLDRTEVFLRGDDAGLRIAVRVKLVKPLKK